MKNDTISRSALLEKECCGRVSGNDVRNAPSVDAEPVRLDEAAQPKWISVEDEQKPRHGKEYLCVCALQNDPKHEWDWIMVLRWYSHGSNGLVDRPHFTDEGVNGMYVTHWMPLPEPPKEET